MAELGNETVLCVGVSTRGLVESAMRAGIPCASIDAFGDLDQCATAYSLHRHWGRRYSAGAIVALARDCPAPAVAYTANLENHPTAVRRLASGRRLLGNTPASLDRVRSPQLLATVVRESGESFPITLGAAHVRAMDPQLSWLRKPGRGGGGSGIAPFSPGTQLSPHEIVQERVQGTPASATFVADGRGAALLGVSQQLIGLSEFGTGGFRYCGSLYPLPIGEALHARLAALVDGLAAAFGLRGVNGVDFVLRGDEIFVLEVNPRYSASMELVERALGFSIFSAHLQACTGELRAPSASPRGVFGKAILFARREVVLGDTRPWLARDDLRDIPHPGTRIPRGHPICTVFARASEPALCRERLAATAFALEREIYGREHRSHAVD